MIYGYALLGLFGLACILTAIKLIMDIRNDKKKRNINHSVMEKLNAVDVDAIRTIQNQMDDKHRLGSGSANEASDQTRKE